MVRALDMIQIILVIIGRSLQTYACAEYLDVSQSISDSSDLPFQVFDTDFLPSLLIIVEPFSLL